MADTDVKQRSQQNKKKDHILIIVSLILFGSLALFLLILAS